MPIVINRRNQQPQQDAMGNIGNLMSGIGSGYSASSGGGLGGLFGGGGGGGAGGWLSGLFGGGGGAAGATGAAGSSAGSAGAGGAGALGGLGVMAWPLAAITGASILSTNASKYGGGRDNWLDWAGPLYNVPKQALKGNWEGVFSDAATGPVGATYNIFKGKNPLKSILNSFGPAGQVPLALGKGQLPLKGKTGSRTYIDAFTGKGIW